MPSTSINGFDLYYETAGSGPALVFIHELAGDYRSWEPQMRAFARSHLCVTYSARGYLPSSVPADDAAYSQKQAAADAIGLLDHLGIERAHFVGLSMGGFATVQIGLDYPERVLSLTIASCGSGSERHVYHEKQAAFHRMAQEIRQQGVKVFVDACATDTTRNSFMRKDPRGWAEFCGHLSDHSPEGMAKTLQQVQGGRPSLWDLSESLSDITAPALILCGDLDEPVLQPSLFLSRTLRNADLAIVPGSGHVLNLEEPDTFNQLLRNFLARIAK